MIPQLTNFVDTPVEVCDFRAKFHDFSNLPREVPRTFASPVLVDFIVEVASIRPR